jgi:hypothetical protein
MKINYNYEDIINNISFLDNNDEEEHLLFLNDFISKKNKTLPDWIWDDSLYKIDRFSLSNCKNLTSITIPEQIEDISESAFNNCYNLNEIILPNKLIKINHWAFNGTAYYEDETNWEDGILYIGNHLINVKKDLISSNCVIKDNTKTIAHYSFMYCDTLTDLIIPDSVEFIGNQAFYDCSNLTTITIGDGLIKTGNSAFSYCNNIQKIYINNLGNWCSNINLFSDLSASTKENIELYLNNELITQVTIPNNIKNIKHGAF